jgi:hypothetical protein
MGDNSTGTAYSIGVQYAVDSDNQVVVNSTSINPTPPSGSNTTVDSAGNITMAKKDTSTISYSCGTTGWQISQLQMRDKDKDKWGKQTGSNRLTDDEKIDYPDVPADSGTVNADSNGHLSISNSNSKASKFDYRVSVTNGTQTLWSDPRIKDNGN